MEVRTRARDGTTEKTLVPSRARVRASGFQLSPSLVLGGIGGILGYFWDALGVTYWLPGAHCESVF